MDTIARSTTTAEVPLLSPCTRVWFDDCFFSCIADNSGHLFVKIDAAQDLDRLAMFKNCVFYNAIESAGTQMLQAFNVHDEASGVGILQGCTFVGCDNIAIADNGNIYTADPVPTTTTSCIAVAVAR